MAASAADAQHIAAEIVGRYSRNAGPAPRSHCHRYLGAHGLANDYGFEQCLHARSRGLGQRGDVLVALTTLGTVRPTSSPFVHPRPAWPRHYRLHRTKGESLARTCDHLFMSRATTRAVIQQIHLTALHAFADGSSSARS